MSNIHIQTLDGSEVTAILHFAIPATNNSAGMAWRAIAARVFGKTTLPDGDGTLGTISAAEKSQIVAGSVVEQTQTFKLGQGFPTGAQMDAAFSAAQSAFLAALQAQYAQYGLTR
jgi:hypothetical protein